MSEELGVQGSGERYDGRLVAAHWLTVALVIAVIAIGFGHDLIEARATRRLVMDIHRLLGLSIVAVVVFRAVLRLMTPAPSHGLPRWQGVASGLAHAGLYVLLVALPVVGLAQTAAARAHPTLFGVIPLPALVEKNRDLAEALGEWHERGAWALIVLVGLHAAAALWHHYGRKDGVLAAMSPFSSKSAAS